MSPSSIKQSSPVAYVYVQTSNGTVLYDASSSGKLTLVAGSPFNTSGDLIGSNGTYLITFGIHDLHTYKVAANGALGPQTSQFDTQSYAGGQCGTTSGAVLDHSGQDVYVSLKGAPAGDGNDLCDALQTSSLSSSSGMFTFKGDLLVDDDSKTSGSDTLPVLFGNNKFAYSLEGIADGCEHNFNIFARESSGALEFAAGQNVTLPVGTSGGYYYYPAVEYRLAPGAAVAVIDHRRSDRSPRHRPLRGERCSLRHDESPTAWQLHRRQ